jgi:8-oxo-dGTP pyrophosphatase MutT (NUDIX family)
MSAIEPITLGSPCDEMNIYSRSMLFPMAKHIHLMDAYSFAPVYRVFCRQADLLACEMSSHSNLLRHFSSDPISIRTLKRLPKWYGKECDSTVQRHKLHVARSQDILNRCKSIARYAGLPNCQARYTKETLVKIKTAALEIPLIRAALAKNVTWLQMEAGKWISTRLRSHLMDIKSQVDVTKLLGRYQPTSPRQLMHKKEILLFIQKHTEFLHRLCLEGHLTASAFVVNKERTQVLLMHHTKLDRWLQPGGHADGDPDLLAVALRETQEECGISKLKPVSNEIFDLDIHMIPERLAEPTHWHYDIRFLIEGDPEEPLQGNHESKAIRWVPFSEVQTLTKEESILRPLENCMDETAASLPYPF